MVYIKIKATLTGQGECLQKWGQGTIQAGKKHTEKLKNRFSANNAASVWRGLQGITNYRNSGKQQAQTESPPSVLKSVMTNLLQSSHRLTSVGPPEEHYR